MTQPCQPTNCQACGACCSIADDWPRFTMESETYLDGIPAAYVSDDLRGMRCREGRCSALMGTVGVHTACGIYDMRPDVCRACVPGGEDCGIARAAFKLPAIEGHGF